MKRRPQEPNLPAIRFNTSLLVRPGQLGLVLSGGGSRAAYQAGALRALLPYLRTTQPISVIVGSSIGAINGIVLGACLKYGPAHAVDQIQQMWLERTFRNTFRGSPSRSFLKAIKIAAIQYMSPGPKASRDAIFDPTPLVTTIDKVLQDHGGLRPENRDPNLKAVAVMTTMEGAQRKPLLFASVQERISPQVIQGATFEVHYVDDMHAKHGFASAALPSILPPVELDSEAGKIHLVDGGISQNVPVDPAARLGADHIIIVDISGRNWWLDRYGEAHDTRPSWEVPANPDTFCVRPPETFIVRCRSALGPILKHAVSGRTSRFIAAVGPVWPLFTLLRQKAGEEVAYEVMSYVALDPEYLQGLIEMGFHETSALLKNKESLQFTREEPVQQL